MPSTDNKRLAKNTLLLYVRMIVMMLITLYTSRLVLQTLGVEDYGVYNVVGGIVALFTFINNALVGASQRYINFELGRGKEGDLAHVFSVSMIAHVLIAVVIIVLAETIGLWFLYEYIKIPSGRMEAALWVYHSSVIGVAVNILRAPYNAIIIAYERMSAYAYMTIIEALGKLLIVFVLLITAYDKLKVYALLVLVVTVVVTLCYKLYCNHNFRATRLQWIWDRPLLRQLLSFSGWSFFGSAASVGVSQGLNVLQNLFFGVVVNAAMGIANQVNAAINQFAGCFQTAFRPQIVKSYAAGEYDYLLQLMFRSSKVSFFLLFLPSLPVLICCDEVLTLWLGDVPPHAVTLCQWMLIGSLLGVLVGPLGMVVEAVGKIRLYQIAVSAILVLNIPFGYAALKFGGQPEALLIIQAAINILGLFARLAIVHRLLPQFLIRDFCYHSIFPCLGVTLLSVPSVYCVRILFNGLPGFLITIVLSLLISSLLIYFIGLNRSERFFIRKAVLNKLRRPIR